MAVQIEGKKRSKFRVGPVCTNPYPAHMHDPVEMAIVRKGHLMMTVNGITYNLEPNTLIIVFPGVVHSYESASEDAAGLFVGFSTDSIAEYRNTLATMWPVVPKVWLKDCPPEVEEAIEKLEGYSGREGSFPLMLAYIHVLVSCVFTQLKLVPADEVNRDNFAYRVMSYIQQHSNENLTQESVAREMGVGRSYLSRLFSQKMNVNFRRFLNTIRIEKACTLLQDTKLTSKEVCYECGFENTRTFHRVFLEEQKMTPGEFRERMRKGLSAAYDDSYPIA